MKQITKYIEAIKKPDQEIKSKALDRLANQARPAGSLGILEEVGAKLASIAVLHDKNIGNTLDVKLKNKFVVTCAGDHGVVEEGVSLFPQEVTPQMVENFVNGGASINVLAKHAGATVKVADFGVNFDFKPDMPIFHKKVRKATSNFTKEPAMSREEAIKSIYGGISIVEELINDASLKGDRVDIIGTGDMGIGNTTPSSAIIAAFSGISVEELTGRGTGINDEMLKNKIRVIQQALDLHKPDPSDPIDMLSKVGGFEIGGLAGLVIGAAAYGIPVVCDGIISTAGALIAYELAPNVIDYLFAGHRSVEVGHKFMHQRMGLEPLLDIQFRLGEGTGAALAFQLMDAATRILAEIKTFEEVAIINAQKEIK
ncbi:MAG: nicotinate-nucleotide--dimethylbenzimidazole phosphoribosyltransferase [Desulfamplus sp.]|nr:nicotinate-nucleotide--dimethylbenzimidazole phosphoribosyltransferase [Desulfamplus sp.]